MYKITARLIAILMMTATFLSVSGCGQKGDLYLPEQSSASVNTSHRLI